MRLKTLIGSLLVSVVLSSPTFGMGLLNRVLCLGCGDDCGCQCAPCAPACKACVPVKTCAPCCAGPACEKVGCEAACDTSCCQPRRKPLRDLWCGLRDLFCCKGYCCDCDDCCDTTCCGNGENVKTSRVRAAPAPAPVASEPLRASVARRLPAILPRSAIPPAPAQ